MRKLILLFSFLFLLFQKGYSQTTLTAGDIAIIAFQTDDPDQFAFVLLTDVASGTAVNFTDNGWNGTTSTLATNEGTITWTASSALTAGTVITWTSGAGFSTGTQTVSTSPAFSTSGDQLLAYQGTSASPTFIYAVSSNTWITSGSTTANTSYLPSGLTNGTSARDFTTETDNQHYNITSISDTKSNILASIGTTANWTRNNAYITPLPSWTFTVNSGTSPSISTGGTTSLSGFTYIAGSGPSSSQSFNITASNLSPSAGNISVSGSTNYEVSPDNTSWSASFNIAYTGGAIGSTPVYVRLKSGLSAGTYNGESISLNGGTATASVTANGTVMSGTPTVSANVSSLSGFTTSEGTPSAAQSFTVDGANLTANVVITAPADYEVSFTAGSGYASSISVTPTGGTIPTTTVYVRIRAAALAGSPSGNVTITSTGATTQNVAVSGTVNPSPSISVSSSTLSGFSSTQGTASASQSFDISGTALTNDITITAPVHYQVSLNNTSFSPSVTVTHTGGTVATTTIYVRLKANAMVGAPSGNVSATSTGATTRNVAVSGTVNQGTISPFTIGNLAVTRVGTGTGSLVNTGNPVYIDEYTAAGELVQSIPIPATASGGNNPLILAGTSTSEGLLTRSPDGAYLTLAGYGTTVGGASSLSGTDATTVARTIAIIDVNGNVNTTTALTDFASTSNPRSAVTSDGTSIWVTGGTGGVRSATVGATTSTGLTTLGNLRQVSIFNNQLYASTNSSASGNTIPLAAIGSGLPTTTGQTMNALTGLPTLTGTSYYSFHFADLDAGVAGDDVLYIADDNGSIFKYSLVGGTWTSNGSVSASGIRGLALRINGTTVNLFGTTGSSSASGGGSLYHFSDITGYNGAISGSATVIATASANTVFRGLALTPGSSVVMPVKFTKVSAIQKGHQIQIDWTNATEENVESYTIERSSNGRNFNALEKVTAKLNNGDRADYHIVDASPLQGNNFYRIKAVETNGKTIYSNIVRISTNAKGTDLVVYPNPIKGSALNLQLVNLPAGKYVIKLYAMNGQEVDSRVMTHAGGSVTETFMINILKPGAYSLQVSGGINLQKLIIAE